MADRARSQAGARQDRGRRRGLALGAALAAIPVVLLAQEDGGGGVRLAFTVDGRLESHSNADFTPGGSEPSIEAVARLGFGAVSETRASRLAFDAGGELRYVLDGPEDIAEGFVNPDLRLSYGRTSADAAFDADLFWRERDLATDREFDDFDTASGERREIGGGVALRWGETRRVGYGLSADYIDTTYTDPDENDFTRTTLGGTMRLDLNPATALTFGLTGSRLDSEDDEDDGTTVGLDTGLSFARPDGTLTFGLSFDDDDDGLRTGFDVGRSFERPAGGYGYRLGVTRDVDGELRLTGGLNVAQDLPRGRLTADLSREIGTASDSNSERLITLFSVGLTQELTPLTSLSLTGAYGESLDPSDDSFTRNFDAGATLSHQLTQDWLVDAGVSYSAENTDDAPQAEDTTVFIGVRRTFEGWY
jgi:hypothetical protein